MHSHKKGVLDLLRKTRAGHSDIFFTFCMILDAIWVVDNSSIHIFEKWSPLMSGKWVLFSNSPKISISLTSEYSIFQKHELICYLQPKWHSKSCKTGIFFKKVARVPNPNDRAMIKQVCGVKPKETLK